MRQRDLGARPWRSSGASAPASPRSCVTARHTLAGSRTTRVLPPLPDTVICPEPSRAARSRHAYPQTSEMRRPTPYISAAAMPRCGRRFRAPASLHVGLAQDALTEGHLDRGQARGANIEDHEPQPVHVSEQRLSPPRACARGWPGEIVGERLDIRHRHRADRFAAMGEEDTHIRRIGTGGSEAPAVKPWQSWRHSPPVRG